MLKKVSEFLTSILMTAISGALLLFSFLFPILFDIELPIYLDTAWLTVFISGLPLVIGAVRKIVKNKGISKISSSLLISIAMIAAIIIGDLFAAGEVAFIMAVGEILEDKTTDRAKRGLKDLISLVPDTARKIFEEESNEVLTNDLNVGDVIRVLPGETIPVDGVIIKGQTSVDQSVITGESLPIDKEEGDKVFSGTINRFGVIEVRVEKVVKDSSIQKLINLIKKAEENKAPTQRIADKWASWLVPLSLLIAIVSGVVMKDLIVAVTVLVVFCPCALVLATPTAIMAAIGQATKHGVIIKSGEALEKMGKVNAIAFDKTGTITTGKLEVSNVINYVNDIDVLSISASIESVSEHPIGKAIANYAKEQSTKIYDCENFSMKVGKGVSGIVSGKRYHCGQIKYLEDFGITLNKKQEKDVDILKDEGKAVVIVSDDKTVVGIVALSDTLKDGVDEVIEEISQLGVQTFLLTGDNNSAAQYVGKQVKIDQIRAELMPEQKLQVVNELKANGKTVCVVGDGVNDAPALKTADVGVAMGTFGSDMAIDAADVALMGDDIKKVSYLKKLSKVTVRTIKFGIALSMIINVTAIVLSVLGLLNPTTGALVHNGGSFVVILIAMLLYDRKIK